MKVAGIILASGHSSRMKQPKAELLIDGERIVDRLRRVYREVVSPVIVVGHDIRGQMDGEMIDSLAIGIAEVRDADAAVVQPVDAPFTTSDQIRMLVDGFTGPRALAFQGTPGHPVLVPASLFPAIEARPSGGLRTLMADAELIEAGTETVLADLDTPEDLVRWKVDG